MPDLDYAIVCDYVRSEAGVAHVIAAGVDTVTVTEVPTGINLGLLIRLTFSRNECGRPHRVEVIFQGMDGERHARIEGVVTPDWNETLPGHWRQGALLGLNVGLPVPAYGEYALEVMVNDSEMKTIQLRVVEPPAASES